MQHTPIIDSRPSSKYSTYRHTHATTEKLRSPSNKQEQHKRRSRFFNQLMEGEKMTPIT